MVRDMITVFTSSYNYSKHLKRAIDSVMSQTYKDFEYHLIDYGSTDDTWDIMQQYAKDPRVKTIKMASQTNKVFAMNESIRMAKGDFWVWCPADDFLHPKMLERSLFYAARHPGAVLYHDAYLVDNDNKQIGKRKSLEYTDKQLRKIIWQKSVIGFTGIFIPTSIFRDTGLYFPENENYSEDYRWMIEAVMNGVKFRRVPECLSYKRKHGGSCTKREYKDIIANIKVIHKELKEKYNVD